MLDGNDATAAKNKIRGIQGLAAYHYRFKSPTSWLYAIEPAWMWMYWVDPARLPLVGVIMVFLLYEACYVAGFVLAAEIEHRRTILSEAIPRARSSPPGPPRWGFISTRSTSSRPWRSCSGPACWPPRRS